MPTNQSFSDQLRHAIENCGKTRYRVGVDTGIAHSILSRFVNQGAGLSLANIDKVCECIGARLVLEPRKKPESPPKKGRNNG
jgi:hypothetical protein